jgi:hypothetical protein
MEPFDCVKIANNDCFGESYLVNSGRKDITNTDYLNFCFLYIGPNYYTLAWNGEVDFYNLEKIALTQLPNKLDMEISSAGVFDTDIFLIDCSLIITAEEDRLVKYRFGDNPGRDDYATAIKNHRRISFARYNVHNKLKSQLSGFSFSAENFRNVRCKRSFTEIAVRQPISHKLKTDLLEWILHNHKDTSRFSGLNVNNGLQKINECIYGFMGGDACGGAGAEIM